MTHSYLKSIPTAGNDLVLIGALVGIGARMGFQLWSSNGEADNIARFGQPVRRTHPALRVGSAPQRSV